MTSRRTPLAVAAVLSAVLAGAACSAEPPDAPTTAPDTTSAAAPTSTPPESEDPTVTPREATRALLRAATEGDTARAREAIEAGADLEARGADRRTPLIIATKANRPDLARVLLDAGADPNAQDAIQDSAFLYAGAEGYDEILELTLQHGAKVASTNRYGGTALIPASEHGHTSTVRILINAGVPVDHVNDLGWTAMLEAVTLGDGSADQVDVVRQLISAGADTGIPDIEGRTPHDLAVQHGYDELAATLDDAPAIRQQAQQLIEAARVGDVGEVRTLLRRQTSVAARDEDGATALAAAAYGNHLDAARLLLEAGADPNAEDESVQSAYLIATSEVGDDPRLLRLTLEHGADVRSLDSFRGTGLIRAAERGHPEIVRALLDAGVEVDHVNRLGWTALHEAVLLGDGGTAHRQTVALLVDAGADQTVRDPRGRTPLDGARELGFNEVAALLDP